jgi:hypothetical protein
MHAWEHDEITSVNKIPRTGLANFRRRIVDVDHSRAWNDAREVAPGTG